MNKALICFFIVINIITFLVFGYDKWLAKNNRKRISEFNLLLLAGVGGNIGGLLGMNFFKHKTNKFSFILVFYSILILQIVLLYFGIQMFKS
ncbi:DUF1294 domain-containing protein [Flavobacterium tibetense]|jgi:uncharacterized membrane protein YsdA (DUF1294 family)|uniref:DUF1294 domain-containing protein n=1 Tax=Flavobacterium tibetense TaxID=2233533 RepID=A0A365P551_9FLAO|nr:DUF1294 domain-containing protein [Flavobacterium tibetense]RBA29684.1 DUF1294 domain-containing protein [Flavobacterium tibetense]